MEDPVPVLRAQNKHIFVPGVPSHEERREIQGEEHEILHDAVSFLPQDDPQGARAGLEVDAHRLPGAGGAPEQHAAAQRRLARRRWKQNRGARTPSSRGVQDAGHGAGFAHMRGAVFAWIDARRR